MDMQHHVVGIMPENCYFVISNEKNAAIIDPGGSFPKLKEAIEEQGLTVKYILLTHGHWDHIGACADLVALTGAPLGICEPDAYRLTSPDVKALDTYKVKRQEPSFFVKEGDVIAFDDVSIDVLQTPGHSKGSVVYRCGEWLFTGDTLFREEVGRCDLEGGDWNEMLESLRKLVALPGDYKVFPGHDAASTLEHERQHNKYIREALKG